MATSTSNELAIADQNERLPRTISDLLRGPELKAAVKAALPKHLQADRFIRVALNATMRQPELLQCTRESFFRCLLDLSALGLEADGRRAHLIPFWNNSVKPRQREVQLIIDYKGISELVRRSGDVSYIHADVVYDNDEWGFAYGSGAFLKHKPNLTDRGGRVIAVYSFVKLRDGSEDFIVLSAAEVEAVRKRSKTSGTGPWVTDWPEMAKKTAFRRHSKWLPLSAESRDAIEKDDELTGVDISDALNAVQEDAPMRASISLDQVKASTEENRGHDAVAPASEAEMEELPA
jgi:recombination protein RecT